MSVALLFFHQAPFTNLDRIVYLLLADGQVPIQLVHPGIDSLRFGEDVLFFIHLQLFFPAFVQPCLISVGGAEHEP